eukprot:gene12716-15959_t
MAKKPMNRPMGMGFLLKQSLLVDNGLPRGKGHLQQDATSTSKSRQSLLVDSSLPRQSPRDSPGSQRSSPHKVHPQGPNNAVCHHDVTADRSVV